MYRIDFVFTKKGVLRYISHLDLMRLFTRAVKRAHLPVKMTEGFNPHPKLRLNRALKLGVESDHEEGSVFMNYPIALEDFKNTMQKQLPKEIEVRDAKGNFN